MSPREASTKPDSRNGLEREGCRDGFPRDSIQTKVMKNLLHGTSYMGILCKEFVVNQAEKEHVEGKNMKDCSPSRQDQKYIFFGDCAENSWIKPSTQWLIIRQTARSLIPFSTKAPGTLLPCGTSSHSSPGSEEASSPRSTPGQKGLAALRRARMEGEVVNVERLFSWG